MNEVTRRISLLLLALTISGASLLRAEEQEPATPGEAAGPKMKQYFVALLYKGPTWTPSQTPETTKLQQGHRANIRRLAAEGKMALAGPFEDAGDLRGLFVLNAANIEEARALCATDPAIKAGRLRAEVYAWWAPEGVGVINLAQPSP